ncbi:MAG TPA: FAD-dependent oxidoreductase [Candidatus Limnocylindria bacterium]|jgi:3-phenylpropionate/trans-cinnamate dioxygenase ferredoxin reductase subunit
MSGPDSVVIVGGGLAGATAAFALRKQGFAGRVVLVSEEDAVPYQRPPLSKGYLRGETSLEDAYVKPAAEYVAHDIELLRGRLAATLDPAARRVTLHDGLELAYDALLIATGAGPRPLAATRAYLPGLHYLRTAGDADALREAADMAHAIVVVGGGWVGAEVTASLRQLGHRVTLVSNLPRPLERVLGPEVADVYRSLHEEHGVRLVHGRVAALEGERHVEAVRLIDGRRFAADLVVAGVGAAPCLSLALRGGLDLREGGIAVDASLRTSAPDVYAAGDVAAAWHPRYGRHLRVEHWDNAIRQGRTAAANILGAQQTYDRVPYFYSDQFDLGMEYRGYAPQWDSVVLRGDVAARRFHAFWLTDGRVVAAMNANLWDDAKSLRHIVESGEPVDVARLVDASVPLADAA